MTDKNDEAGANNGGNPTRKELQAWATKMIADARPKKKMSSKPKKKRVSRKEYIDNMAMKEKWWEHYGRNPWY